MPDIAAIADMLARGGPVELKEVEQEIALCEQRLTWLNLIRDTLRNGGVKPRPAPAEAPKPRNTNLREQVCAAMNGEWVSVRDIADKTNVPTQNVRVVLNTCPHLFEKRETGEFTPQHHACVEYRKRTPPGQPKETSP